jgi:hypothetical protein
MKKRDLTANLLKMARIILQDIIKRLLGDTMNKFMLIREIIEMEWRIFRDQNKQN